MKKKLRIIHKWSGIFLFLLFVVQGLTGFIMSQKDIFVNYSFGQKVFIAAEQPPLALDETLSKFAKLYPDHTTERLIYPADHSLPLIARMKKEDDLSLAIIHIDRQSGYPTSHGSLWQYPAQLAERVHVSLLVGSTGHIILLVEALLLTFMIISGVIVWWPQKRNIAKSLRMSFNRGGKRLLRDTHVVPAIILAPFMFLSAVTGVLLITEDYIRPVVGIFAPVGPELDLDLPVVAAPDVLTPFQTGKTLLDAEFDDGRVKQLRFMAGGRLLAAVIHAENPLNPRAYHIAGVDRFTGDVIVFTDANKAVSGDKFINWFLPVHSGEAWGLFRTLVMSAVGLLLILSSITGIVIWVQRQSAKSSARSSARSSIRSSGQ